MHTFRLFNFMQILLYTSGQTPLVDAKTLEHLKSLSLSLSNTHTLTFNFMQILNRFGSAMKGEGRQI